MGCAQTAVRRGFHHDSEQFFRMQRAAGGPLGYEGPGNPLQVGRCPLTFCHHLVMGTGWARVEPASIAQGKPRKGGPAFMVQGPQARHGGPVDIEGWRNSKGEP